MDYVITTSATYNSIQVRFDKKQTLTNSNFHFIYILV